jgi:hypothetical protein
VLELRLGPGTDRYDPADERWLRQANDLYADLRGELDGVRKESVPVPGSKGAVESMVLALGSANAFLAAVQCFRAWLQRDRTRHLEITWTTDDGREEKVVLRGDAIDVAPLKAVAEGAARRIGGEPWQIPDTEPS